MTWQVGLYLAATLSPLLAFGSILGAGRRLSGRAAGLVAIGAVGFSFALSLVGLAGYWVASGYLRADEPPAWRGSVAWLAVGDPASGPGLVLRWGLHIDNLAALLFVVVTGVALAVVVYARESLGDDPKQGRFFAEILLFCGAMLGLLGASDLLQLFVAWELVGFCSFLLVGFWGEAEANARAAQKAFLVNRVGDFGMLVALGVLWASVGTLDIATLNRAAPGAVPPGLLTLAGLGLVAGALAKSAQFPLHVWLPDAMAGPTPASALIHAATMVAAGVYLLARIFPVLTPEVLLIVAYLGAITLVLAGAVAGVQDDYKRVLAYSTISQLGFMVLALGVGGRSAALFHLWTHAWFKATLFLAAGSVYAATHTYKMAELGGLWRRLPVTSRAMLVATLALAGFPGLSGFASKDAILATSLHYVQAHPRHFLLFLAPAVGSALTAFYAGRLWFLVFAGEPRTEAARVAVEPGRPMRGVLLALMVPCVAAGWSVALLPLGFEPLAETWLRFAEPGESVDPGGARFWAMGASVLVGAIGLGLGVLAYGPWDAWRRIDPRRAAERFAPGHRFLVSGGHLDTIYHLGVVRAAVRLAQGLGWGDRRGLDALVDASARGVERFSRVEGFLDRRGVDGLVGGVASGVGALGRLGQRLQAGQLRGYLLILAGAVVGLGGLIFVWVLA